MSVARHGASLDVRSNVGGNLGLGRHLVQVGPSSGSGREWAVVLTGSQGDTRYLIYTIPSSPPHLGPVTALTSTQAWTEIFASLISEVCISEGSLHNQGHGDWFRTSGQSTSMIGRNLVLARWKLLDGSHIRYRLCSVVISNSHEPEVRGGKKLCNTTVPLRAKWGQGAVRWHMLSVATMHQCAGICWRRPITAATQPAGSRSRGVVKEKRGIFMWWNDDDDCHCLCNGKTYRPLQRGY